MKILLFIKISYDNKNITISYNDFEMQRQVK